MSRFNTGNPIGSNDKRDLSDNSRNLDEFVNSDDLESYPDRLGVSRKTWFGIEEEFDAAQADKAQRFDALLAASGYEYLADYAAGIEITEYNQVIRDSAGEFWRASGATTLPYTTDGTGLPESGAFVSVGDAALRSELAGEPATGNGALKARGAVIYVDTIADLQALPTSGLVDGHVANVQGSNLVWDSSLTVWKAVGPITIRAFGTVGDGISDDTAAINSALGFGVDRVVGTPGDVYLVTSKISPAAGQTLDLRGSVLKMAGGTSFTSTDSVVELVNAGSSIINFEIDGNKASVSHSIGNGSDLAGLVVKNSRTKALNGKIHDCKTNGYIIYASAVEDAIVDDVESYDNGINGFMNEIPEQGDVVTNGIYWNKARSWGNGAAGIYLASGRKVRISDSDFEGSNESFLYIGDAQGILEDCKIVNSRISTTGGAVDPLEIQGEVQTGTLSGNRDTCQVELVNVKLEGAGGGAFRIGGGAEVRYANLQVLNTNVGMLTTNDGRVIEGRSLEIDTVSTTGLSISTTCALDGVTVKNWGASYSAILLNGSGASESLLRNLTLGDISGEGGQHGISESGSPTDIVIDGYYTFTGSGAKFNILAGTRRDWYIINTGDDEDIFQSGDWTHRAIWLGSGYIWIDSTGVVRTKQTKPLNDTDGVVVGSQT